ncbi:MAG: B12-binding domain-containing protein [FCB group bacterium]|nr:B12-binding domain-containing protein [FCB group bacterium]MBL7028537.1 B12-binding domain-containing protein [Candidatus Neomarinimicrobiota bacterium]MBL7120756.1 B12-binding domain-containing protein [Candidatus Neomarinimicrobiota bacterium]
MMKPSEQSSSYLSSVDVARILDVNVATVKRWTEAGKLDCVKTAGGHRKFLMRHLAAFAIEHQKYAQHLPLIPFGSELNLDLNAELLRGEFKELIPFFLEKAILCDSTIIQNILNSLYMVHHDLVLIYDDLITPVLHEIGSKWERGELSITEEHLASQSIRDAIIKMQDIVVKPEIRTQKAFVLTFSEELHDIPAKMVQHLLEVRGFQVLYSGQRTPAGETSSVFESFHPERVYVSSIFVENAEQSQAEFKELLGLCRANKAELFVGGSGIDQLKIKEDDQLHRLWTFKDVMQS